MIYHFILVNLHVSLLHILIASDQFVNIVYMLLLYLIYLIGLSEINEFEKKNRFCVGNRFLYLTDLKYMYTAAIDDPSGS